MGLCPRAPHRVVRHLQLKKESQLKHDPYPSAHSIPLPSNVWRNWSTKSSANDGQDACAISHVNMQCVTSLHPNNVLLRANCYCNVWRLSVHTRCFTCMTCSSVCNMLLALFPHTLYKQCSMIWGAMRISLHQMCGFKCCKGNVRHSVPKTKKTCDTHNMEHWHYELAHPSCDVHHQIMTTHTKHALSGEIDNGSRWSQSVVYTIDHLYAVHIVLTHSLHQHLLTV